MRRWFWLSALIASAAAYAGPREVVLEVAGMTCATCPIAVRMALKRVPGVSAARVDLASGTARVAYDDAKTDPTTVAKAATDAGYPTTILRR